MSIVADNRPRGSLEFILTHHISRGLPTSKIEIPPEDPPLPEDAKIVERLLAAHDRAIHDEAEVLQRPYADVWEMIRHEFHGGLVDALHRRSINDIAQILGRAFRENITYGLGGGVVVYDSIRTSEGNAATAALTLDRLMALAEALALLPHENPEQGRWGENLYLPPEDVSAKVEKALGISICPPPVCGYYGIRLSSGLLFAMSCGHIYSAWRLQQILASNSSIPNRVAEIGGGFGGCAYYSFKLGMRDYRIFDLPLINVLQGYYLLKALPNARIVLYGEKEMSDAICLYPYWTFKDQRSKSLGVVLNQDSFPEIAPYIVTGYLNDIVRSASYLISINQEGHGPSCRPDLFQNVVPKMADEIKNLKRIARYPFWLRRGYVEEVYQVRR